MYGRRRSSTRCIRRVVSDRLSSSSWNGGVTDGFSTVSSWHSTSILPLLRLSLVVPSGRARTKPLTCTQNSLRKPSAVLNISARSGSHTTCTYPSRSRRSTKITPPWSRLRLTQPHRVTVWPIRASVTRPQYVVRSCMEVPSFRGKTPPLRSGASMVVVVECGRDDAHRNDVLQRLVDRHLQLD